MNKRIKNLWVAALLSGDYKQGIGALRDKQNLFCCLGVLCNIHAQEHPSIAKHQDDSKMYMGRLGLLPVTVMKWAGISEQNQQKAIMWNDIERCKFKTIARNIEVLF